MVYLLKPSPYLRQPTIFLGLFKNLIVNPKQAIDANDMGYPSHEYTDSYGNLLLCYSRHPQMYKLSQKNCPQKPDMGVT